MKKSFRSRLWDGQQLLGMVVSMRTPDAAELLAEAGFDWLFIDNEHGAYSIAELQAMLQAAGRDFDCLIRIPALEESSIKKALDIGASGVIVPQVNTAEQAACVVRWGRYPPAGGRGLGIARAQHYGFGLQEYADNANERIALVIQAESAEAAANIESIVQVAGIDAVFIGPYDLSASLGKTGEVDHPAVQQAIAHITRVCKLHHMPLGIFGGGAEAVRPYLQQGFQLIAAGVDAALLGSAAREMLARMRHR